MIKYFYSHLVSTDSISQELDQLDISKKEKTALMDIAHTHMHQAVIEAILTNLSEDDKKKFLELLVFGNDEKIWNHLNEKAEKIEDKIKDASESIQKELKEDIKKIKEGN